MYHSRLSDVDCERLQALVYVHRLKPAQLAKAIGVGVETVKRAAHGWREGVGRTAQLAKQAGRWPNTGEVPDSDGLAEHVTALQARAVAPVIPTVRPVAPVVLTPAVVRLLAKAKAEGQTWRALADTVGMSVLGVTNAVNGWNAGRSRLARQAQAEGTWEAFG